MKKIEYSKTERGWLTCTFLRFGYNAKQRRMDPPTITKEELRSFISNHPRWPELYKGWVESGFDRWHAPSIDRLDNAKNYSLDNIRLVTWRENFEAAGPFRSFWAENRIYTPKTHCRFGHEKSGDNLYVNSLGHHQCMICRRNKANRQYHARGDEVRMRRMVVREMKKAVFGRRAK